MSFFLLLNTKEDILKNVCNRTVDDSIDFHSIFPTMKVNGIHQLSDWPYYSNIFFCVQLI